DIADSIREIQGYLGQADYQDFAQDDYSREAISNQLVQIGGAAALLSDEFKERYGEIDWDILTGLQYAKWDETLELDAYPQWHLVHEDLPDIMNKVLDLAMQLEDEDLRNVTLNEEDYQDVKDLHFKKELEVNPDEEEHIKYQDEAEPDPSDRDMITEFKENLNKQG
ncbi:MAG TPA: hypothetical protein VIK89_02450, partial [Cytophagaceae bacterium]